MKKPWKIILTVFIILLILFLLFVGAIAAKVFLIGEVKNVDTIHPHNVVLTDESFSMDYSTVTSADVMSNYSYRIDGDTLYIKIRTVLVGGVVFRDTIEIFDDLSGIKAVILEDGENEKIVWPTDEEWEEPNVIEIPESPTSTPTPEHLVGIVSSTEITMGSLGWENIRSTAGYPDPKEWKYTVIEPQDGVEIAATVWGTVDGLYDNTITAVVEIIVSEEYPEGKIYKVCYLSGRDVTSDFFGVDETEILDAHNEDLWHCMYSY